MACQDQFARILTRAGLATGVFDARAIDPVALAAAIRAAVGDGLPARRAREWQARVRADGGVKAAADLIESHWSVVRPDGPG